MQTTRITRSSVLGKRTHQSAQSVDASCIGLQTPETTPTVKRVKTSTSILDGDHNKENIPPFELEALNADSSPRATRALRRTSTSEIVTPTRGRPNVIRRASTAMLPPNTPTSEISQVSLTTPPATPFSAMLPIHARAKGLLRATTNSIVNLPGREAERETIISFINSFEENSGEASSLYISGTPGTGKTALVYSVLSTFDPMIKSVIINCMALNNIEVLWERVTEELVGEVKGKKSKGKATLDSVLSRLGRKCILVLDELDHIIPNTAALDNLFTVTDAQSSLLCVIGIANTHTLTASTVPSSSRIRTIHFSPYTSDQLLHILESRLSSLLHSEDDSSKKFIAPPALLLLSKKVAAMTGDVRNLFEVLRGAIDLAVADAKMSVTPPYILAAFKAHFPSSGKPGTSETVCKTRTLGMQARLVLLAALLATRRLEANMPLSSSPSSSPSSRKSSTQSIDVTQLHAYYSGVLSRVESNMLSPVMRNEFGDLLTMLEGMGLLSVISSLSAKSSPVKGGNRALGRSSSFGMGANKGSAASEVKLAVGVSADEVLQGLGAGDNAAASGDIQEEEAAAIWRRETARLAKDIKNAQSLKVSQDGLFTEAMED